MEEAEETKGRERHLWRDVCRVTGRGGGGGQLAGKDEEYRIRKRKTSQNLCAFSGNTGLRVAKGRDLAQSSGKK